MPFGNCSKLSRFSDCQDRFFFSFSAAFFFNTGNLVLIDFPFFIPIEFKKESAELLCRKVMIFSLGSPVKQQYCWSFLL